MRFSTKLRILSLVLQTIVSNPTLSSTFLLEFVRIKSALSLLKKDLKQPVE